DYIINHLEINEIMVFHDIQKVIISEEAVPKALIDFTNRIEKYKLLKRKTDIETELKLIEKKENKSSLEIARIRELCIEMEKILKELKNL
ncbi:MAG: hypothetical protein AB2421_20900, partial [Thermotaleaceae bacterium]